MILAILREFKLLSESETTAFMDAFGEYLGRNGISQTQWDQMNRDDRSTAERIFHLFSLSALEEVIGRIECLELRAPRLATFMMPSDSGFRMITVASDNSNYDLTSESSLLENADNEAVLSERPYLVSRTSDVMELAIRGFRPCEAGLFRRLEKRIPR